MLPYVSLLGASLVGGPLLSRCPKYRRAFLLTLGLACWLLASLRYVTGFDYRSYEKIFQRIAQVGLPILADPGGVEPGYTLLNLAVVLSGSGWRAFLFLFHLLFMTLVFVWIDRYSSRPWLSVYLFLALQYYAMSMNLLRQAFAAAVMLWAYPFLKRRHFLPFCGVVLLSASFHKSALIMIPFYFLLGLRSSRRHYTAVSLAAGAVYVLLDPILQLLLTVLPYGHYMGGKYWQSNGPVYLLFPLGCFLFSLPLARQAARDSAVSPVLANSVFYAALIQCFITRHFILERLSIYVAFFSILALPEAALLPSEKLSSRARTGLLIAGALMYFIYAATQNFHGVYPYHGIWAKALSA